MSLPRFHVPEAAPGARVTLPEHTAHHAREVLRLRSGASVRVFDGSDQLRAWFSLPLEQNTGEGALWLTEGGHGLLATGARGWRSESELQVQDRSEVPPLELALQRR